MSPGVEEPQAAESLRIDIAANTTGHYEAVGRLVGYNLTAGKQKTLHRSIGGVKIAAFEGQRQTDRSQMA